MLVYGAGRARVGRGGDAVFRVGQAYDGVRGVGPVYAAVVAGLERDLQGAGAFVRDLELQFPAVEPIREVLGNLPAHAFLLTPDDALPGVRGPRIAPDPQPDLSGARFVPAVPRIRLRGFPFPRRPVRLALRGGCLLVARFVFSGLALRCPFAPDAARRENGRDQDRGERGDAVSFSASLRELLGLQRVSLSRW